MDQSVWSLVPEATQLGEIRPVEMAGWFTGLPLKKELSRETGSGVHCFHHPSTRKKRTIYSKHFSNVLSMIDWYTLPKFNMVPEKWWLEDYFPIGKITFQGRAVKLQEGRYCLPFFTAKEVFQGHPCDWKYVGGCMINLCVWWCWYKGGIDVAMPMIGCGPLRFNMGSLVERKFCGFVLHHFIHFARCRTAEPFPTQNTSCWYWTISRPLIFLAIFFLLENTSILIFYTPTSGIRMVPMAKMNPIPEVWSRNYLPNIVPWASGVKIVQLKTGQWNSIWCEIWMPIGMKLNHIRWMIKNCQQKSCLYQQYIDFWVTGSPFWNYLRRNFAQSKHGKL